MYFNFYDTANLDTTSSLLDRTIPSKFVVILLLGNYR